MGSTHRITGTMEDGRFMMDYSSSCRINTHLQSEKKIPTWNSTQYRHYLQEHGLQAMNSLQASNPCGQYACADLGAAFSDDGGMPPETKRAVTADAVDATAEQ